MSRPCSTRLARCGLRPPASMTAPTAAAAPRLGGPAPSTTIIPIIPITPIPQTQMAEMARTAPVASAPRARRWLRPRAARRLLIGVGLAWAATATSAQPVPAAATVAPQPSATAAAPAAPAAPGSLGSLGAPLSPSSATGPVVASGTVPDEATKAAVLARLRAVFGAERVQDQLSVGPVVAPPGWAGYVQRIIDPSLRQVGRGQLQIEGNRVTLAGEVGSDGVRRQLAADTQARLNPTYTVQNGLRVATSDQTLLDQTLANRIIEFAPSSAQLLPAGQAILDEMAATLLKLPGRRIEVTGHTDASGSRESNIALSLARADAVKAYLSAKGVPAASITVSGVGPDRPVASNSTESGRARNRRIEFRIGQ